MPDGLESHKLKAIDKSTLKDISTVKIDGSLGRRERIQSFVDQIGNPYCYLDDDVVVSVSYTETEASLEDRIRAYACSLNGSSTLV